MCRLIVFVVCFNFLFAISFVREYTYHVSGDDSKNEARQIALEEVQTLLIEELNVYIKDTFPIDNKEKNSKLTNIINDNIREIREGKIATKVLEERYNGDTFYIKAKIELDEKELNAVMEEAIKEELLELDLEDSLKSNEDDEVFVEDFKNEYDRNDIYEVGGDFYAFATANTNSLFILGGGYKFVKHLDIGGGFFNMSSLEPHLKKYKPNEELNFFGAFLNLGLRANISSDLEIFIDASTYSGNSSDTKKTRYLGMCRNEFRSKGSILGFGFLYNLSDNSNLFLGGTTLKTFFTGFEFKVNSWAFGLMINKDNNENAKTTVSTSVAYNFSTAKSSVLASALSYSVSEDFTNYIKECIRLAINRYERREAQRRMEEEKRQEEERKRLEKEEQRKREAQRRREALNN